MSFSIVCNIGHCSTEMVVFAEVVKPIFNSKGFFSSCFNPKLIITTAPYRRKAYHHDNLSDRLGLYLCSRPKRA